MYSVLLKQNSSQKLIVVFAFFTLLMAIGSYVFFTTQKAKTIEEKQNELASINQFKVQQIVNWKRERLGNAESVFHDPFFINYVNNFSTGVNRSENYNRIFSWLQYMKTIYHYSSVLLLDKNNEAIVKTENAELIGSSGHALIKKVIDLKRPLLSDLHRNTNGMIHLDLIIPLYIDCENRKGFCGILFFRIDPKQFLLPLIKGWPYQSKSAETILVRKEGNKVLFLNELREKHNSALHYSKSLSDTNSPAVRAVLGFTGNFEGVDYRGIKVLANIQKIPDSDWFLLTKEDKTEILESTLRQAYRILFFITCLVLLTGAIVLILWKLHVSNSEREKLLLLKHFDYLVKYANDIIVLSDLEGTIKEVNDKAITVYGYTRDELLKLNIRQLIAPEFVSSFDQIIEDIIKQDGSVYESMQINKNGTTFPVEISERIIEVDDEKYLQKIIRDITERKVIEEALRESEELYKRLINSIPDLIFRCDLEGNILFINNSNIQTYGFNDKKELLGENIFSFIAPEDIERAVRNTKSMFQQYLGPIEYKLILRNGKKADFEVNGDILLNKDGVPSGMVFILRDISEQKRIELSLRKAKEKAEESDRLKTAFLANMSHEIRTPMNGILGFSELLDDDTLTHSTRQRFINIISENSRHLLGVINDIIDISKIDSNQLSVDEISFNLNRLMDEVLMTFLNEKMIRHKEHINILMNKSLSDEKSVIVSDDIRLRQILYNLLGNAIKFTSKGFIKFEYVLVNDKLQFMVQDTGKGISKDKQPIVFNRFRQEEETYTRYFGGSGLGLSISKGLVELLGGRIWLESEEEIGSTFFFTIAYKPLNEAQNLNM